MGEFPEQSWIQGQSGIQHCFGNSPVDILDLGSWILYVIETDSSIFNNRQNPRSKIQDAHGRNSEAMLDPTLALDPRLLRKFSRGHLGSWILDPTTY